MICRINVKNVVVGKDFKFGHNRKGDINLLRKYKNFFNLITLKKKVGSDNIIQSSSLIRNLIENDFGYKYKSLLKLPIESWEEDNVPDWLDQIPITSPGRSGKK